VKLCTIVGARPQFIKAAAVSRIMSTETNAKEVLVHTGQHYDEGLSQIFFEQLGIPTPHYNLNVGSAAHGAQTGRMLEAIENVLLEERPDRVLVYGDTNSTLAGALAAAKLHAPVAHVESGLRSFNRRIPEEVNRVLVDHTSDMLFAPTVSAVENLQREGIGADTIHLVGDIMYDVALRYGAKADEESEFLEALNIEPQNYVLVTIHRAENTNDPIRLAAIFKGLASVAKELPVVLPLHPRTRAVLISNGLLEDAGQHLQILEPVGYLRMLMLEKNAQLIATDSGGVQKEAFYCRVPCVTFREETEWMELIEHGWNRLVSPFDAGDVTAGVLAALGRRGDEVSLYGDGMAAEEIVRQLKRG
jgi:UDP-GlcNAc3NAcA epimerase